MTKAERLIKLCRELDTEMDGGSGPESRAILNAIRSILDEIKDHEIHAEEQARWQDAIYQMLRKSVGDSIDGAGCESDDPLDVTLCEINQALNLTSESDAIRQTDCQSPLSDAHCDALKQTATSICEAMTSDCWTGSTFSGRKVLADQLAIVVNALSDSVTCLVVRE